MLIAGQCTPHFLFHLVEKKTGRARSKRKDRFGRNFAHACKVAVRGSAYRCLLRFCLAFGHAILFCEGDTAVPWRMVPTSSGCKDVFDLLLFPRVPLRYALPGYSQELLPCPMLQLSSTTGQRQRKSAQDVSLYFPGPKDFPKGRAFPSLTSTRKCQLSPAGGRRSALAQTDPPNIFSFPPGAAHFLFDVSKRKWGAHPLRKQPPAGAESPWPPPGGPHFPRPLRGQREPSHFPE